MGHFIFIFDLFLKVYMLLLAVRALLPWFPRARFNSGAVLLTRITEPVMAPIRKGLPPAKVGFDVSPFVAIILLWLIDKAVLSIFI